MLELATHIDQLLEEELLLLVNELKAKHIELGQKASGRWVESLEVIVNNGNGFIYALDYTKYIVKGRKPGERPPIPVMEQWVKDKLGLQGKQALNVAFAVSTNIAKKGTVSYRKGGTDLVDGVITDDRINKLYANLGGKIRVLIAENLRR